MSPAIERYLALCGERDGEPDFPRRRLSRREAFFERLAAQPVRAAPPVEREAFLRNLARTRPERDLPPRALFLLATAKSNQAERFAIDLAESRGRVHEESDPVRLHVTLQEHYHTRILADVVAVFGLPVPPAPPQATVRLLARALVALPEEPMLPLVGASEMAGCVLFRMLRDRGCALWAGDPPVAERIRLLFDEILADEIGHVGFVAARLGDRGRRLMRALYRVVGPRLLGSQPELRQLVGRAAIRRAFADAFPLDAMLAELPGRAFAVARP
jgi:hypothetical protein